MASLFIEGQDGKPINISLLQTLYIDPLDDKIVKFIFINGESISEEYSSAELAQSRLDGIKENLCSNGEGTVNLEIKEITINENGETIVTYGSGYDGLGQVSVTTNIPTININDYEVNTITQNPLSGGYPGILQIIKRLPPDFNIDSGITDGTGLFRYLKNLVEIPNTLDTKNLTKISNMFFNCISLADVPVLNLSGITGTSTSITMSFKTCPSLTDNSLNNIMQSLISITEAYTGTHTLKIIGISQEQATRCQSLSNYQAFIEAGWGTGY